MPRKDAFEKNSENILKFLKKNLNCIQFLFFKTNRHLYDGAEKESRGVQ